MLIKRIINIILKKDEPNRCLAISEIIYKLFHSIDKFSDYKINIVMDFSSEYAQGHAWVTRNGKMFLIPNPSVNPVYLTILGGDEKYVYYTYKRE